MRWRHVVPSKPFAEARPGDTYELNCSVYEIESIDKTCAYARLVFAPASLPFFDRVPSSVCLSRDSSACIPQVVFEPEVTIGFFNLYEDSDAGFNTGSVFASLAAAKKCVRFGYLCTVCVTRVAGWITRAEICPTN